MIWTQGHYVFMEVAPGVLFQDVTIYPQYNPWLFKTEMDDFQEVGQYWE